MKKVIALFLVLGLFAAAPVIAAGNSILASVPQQDVTALADTEMSQIQGELTILLVTDLDAVLSGLLGDAGGLLGGLLGGVVGGDTGGDTGGGGTGHP